MIWGNREILQEIQRLRLEHEQASQPTPEKAQQNPTLLAELRLLRYTHTHLHLQVSNMYIFTVFCISRLDQDLNTT